MFHDNTSRYSTSQLKSKTLHKSSKKDEKQIALSLKIFAYIPLTIASIPQINWVFLFYVLFELGPLHLRVGARIVLSGLMTSFLAATQ